MIWRVRHYGLLVRDWVFGVTEGNAANNAGFMPRFSLSLWSRRTGWTLLFLSLFFSALWFALAFYLKGQIPHSSVPAVAACKNGDVVGFPGAISLVCAPYNLDERLTVSEANLAFPLTDIGRGHLSLKSPAQFQPRLSARGPLLAQWDVLDLTAELTLIGRELEELRLNTRALELIAGPHNLGIDTLSALFVPRNKVDLALRVDADSINAFLPYGLRVAPVDLRGEVVLANGTPRLAASGYNWRRLLKAGASFDILELRLETPDGGQLALAGPVTISPKGTLSGQVRIGAQGEQALVAWAQGLGPQAQQGIRTLIQAVAGAGQPALFGSVTLPAINVQITDGAVRLGFITLGKIPPLRF